MNRSQQIRKAESFRNLHSGPQILVLPNAWDAVSAHIFQQAGFPAIATTSAGIAALFGYPDGQVIPRDEMIWMVKRIASGVEIPVTADIEAGYGATISEVLETVRMTIQSGVVGINLEDSTHLAEPAVMDLRYQSDLIRAVRNEAEASGIPIVINARIDIYLREVGAVGGRFDRVVERAAAFLEAGADCVYPIGLSDGIKIARLVQQVNGPVNILAGPGVPAIRELEAMGVRRVSFGSSLMRATLPVVREIAERLRLGDDAPDLFNHEFTHAIVDRIFRRG